MNNLRDLEIKHSKKGLVTVGQLIDQGEIAVSKFKSLLEEDAANERNCGELIELT